MENEQIYFPKWTYDVWDDIKASFPLGSYIDCKVTSVEKYHAMLAGPCGVKCFLSKAKVSQLWVVNDLQEEIKKDEILRCKVIDYSFKDKSVNVAVKLN